ncbi:NADH:ubiquinone oxidoreductase subunit M [Chloroflexus islandicus]|uniref:NADH:ubiquinone oxidoreductase subunit M n=1 Tax=Chloroflexus islandicus TaxID=1707952 RepID=A0A178MKD4_9CHLR|nr:NADH-quinone oxidoreductase subunit M [Chloroflexus islandicus]OAN48597.1 NADH:ubiquinone oxidoreductase subunit M [Chloroflexus islandicus]
MNLLGLPILSLLLWLPALGSLVILLQPRGRPALYRWTAMGVAIATLLIAGTVIGLFYTGPYGPTAGLVIGPPLQFVDSVAWLPAVGASYLIGVDGINLWLVGLTAFLAPFAIAATWQRQTRSPRLLLALLLLAETAFLGVFLAQDMLLFYVFYELALLPMVFLVGMWGSHGRASAALKLFLYTFGGSLLMLFAMIGLHILHRNAVAAIEPGFAGTFALNQIVADIRAGIFTLDPMVARLLFGAFFIAFAIKLALWPFHTWLPDAYSVAPTPVAIVLAGLMAKFGVYGLIRFNLTLFPEVASWAAPAIAVLAVIGIIYGALIAFTQRDMQRMIAYASISHMNFIALGVMTLNTMGINGALLQMVGHGVIMAALLLIVAVIEERRDSRELGSFGGLWSVTPVYAGLTLLTLLALAGLPGLSGFVGEFTMLQGIFTSPLLGWPFALGAVIGIILAAVYALRLFHLGFMGEVRNTANLDLPDLKRRELLALGALAAVMIALGLFPNLLLSGTTGSVQGLVDALTPAVQAAAQLNGWR